MRIGTLLCAALLLSACGGKQSLLLVADSESIEADGMTRVELSAEIIFRDEAINDGKKVFFKTSEPVLFDSIEAATAEVEGARPSGEAEVDVRTRGGKGVAYLVAPTTGGELTIEASFTTVNKDVLVDALVLDVRPPPLIASATSVGGPSTAVRSRFRFDCDAANVGAFIDTREDPIRVPCSLILQDASGRNLPHTPVAFFAEAGEVEDRPATEDEPRRLTYVIPEILLTMPRDVAPSNAERDYDLVDYEDDLIPGAVEQNPRDGLVTILAVVRGHEGFDDLDGNGSWDSGETWIDEGDCFLDVDDDGVFGNLDEFPSECDANGNGTVDPPNAAWDADVPIGRITHILWSGPVNVAKSGLDPDGFAIAACDTYPFTLRVVDSHYNPVAAHGSRDHVDLSITRNLTYHPPAKPEIPLTDTHAMDLVALYPRFKFGWELPVFESLNVDAHNNLEGREWSFILKDDRSCNSGCATDSWSIEAEVLHTPAEDYRGASFDRLSPSVFGSGQLETTPDPCP